MGNGVDGYIVGAMAQGNSFSLVENQKPGIKFGIVPFSLSETSPYNAIEQDIFVVCLCKPDVSCPSSRVGCRAGPEVIFSRTGRVGKLQFQAAGRAEPVLKIHRSGGRWTTRRAKRQHFLSEIAAKDHLLAFAAEKFLFRRRSYGPTADKYKIDQDHSEHKKVAFLDCVEAF